MAKGLEVGASGVTCNQTAGEILSDGVTIELIRDPVLPSSVTLMSWNGSILQTGYEISCAGSLYQPLQVHESVLKAIRLPKGVAPPEPTRKLFDDVEKLLLEHLGQLGGCTKKLAFAIFSSWLSPALPMAPIIWVFSPLGSPKNQLLRLLDMLCRRPIRLAGVTRGDLRCLPMSIAPTLLLDEPDTRPATQAILMASGIPGSHIRGGDGIVQIYGPKFILSHLMPTCNPLATNALRITLSPPTRQLMPLDSASEEKIGDELQARFLGYFLRNCRDVEFPRLDVSKFALPTQDLARALGAAIVADGELQREIVWLLGDQDEEIRADLSSSFDSVVIEAMMFFIHEGMTKIRAQQAAKKVAVIFAGRGDDRDVRAENIGWAFRRLGIASGRIDRTGNGVELTVSNSRVVHRLAWAFQVPAVQAGFRPDCRYCQELGKRDDTPGRLDWIDGS